MLNIFRRTFKAYLVQNKYRVVPAFKCGGKEYFMFEDQNHVPTGRQLAAVMVYNEMQMKVDRDYLTMHVKAMDKVLSNPRAIDMTTIMKLNLHMKERLGLMVLPDFVYKLASVVFFDKDEPMYDYDLAYNEKKIEEWKRDKEMLDFFLQTPVRNLIPSWDEHPGDMKTYLNLASQIAKIHQLHLTDILSAKT